MIAVRPSVAQRVLEKKQPHMQLVAGRWHVWGHRHITDQQLRQAEQWCAKFNPPGSWSPADERE